VLGVRDVDDPWQGAAVYEVGGTVTRVVEKPPRGTSTTRWNSAGLYAMRPAVFPYLDRLAPSPRNEYELTSIFEMMLQERVEFAHLGDRKAAGATSAAPRISRPSTQARKLTSTTA